MLTFVFAIVVTVAAGMIVTRYNQIIFARSLARNDARAKQASHVGDPLRYGGLAVFIGMATTVIVLPGVSDNILSLLLLLSAAPVVLTGLAEDMGYDMSPKRRLIAAGVSAVVAVGLLGVWVPRADLFMFDWVMSFYVIAVALTVLFSAGFCHAVNLIDGMNGLATINTILSALGLAMLATMSDQTDIAAFALLIAACMAGFLVLNWPSAIMFLGDAGAYGIGHLLTWVAILLVSRVDGVAVPAVILILFWPIADVFHTIMRRVMARKAAFQPDRMHLHHKVRRALDLTVYGYNCRAKSNPMTTVVLAPFMATPVISGVMLASAPATAWLALVVYAIAFAAAHRLTPNIARKYRKIEVRKYRKIEVVKAH